MLKYRLIGLYEQFTGIFGVLLLLLNIGKVIGDRTTFFTFFVGMTLYIGLAAAGYILVKQEKLAVKYSVWMQALQVLSVTYNGKQYLFTASAYLSFWINNRLQFKAQVLPINYNISEVSTFLPMEIRIFFFPLFLILLLLIRKRS
jgi:hypothetical protein